MSPCYQGGTGNHRDTLVTKGKQRSSGGLRLGGRYCIHRYTYAPVIKSTVSMPSAPFGCTHACTHTEKRSVETFMYGRFSALLVV